MIDFLWPFAALLLPLPWLVRRFMTAAPQSPAGALRVPFYRQLESNALGHGRRTTSRRWRLILASIIWALLVTALARPVWVGEELPLPVEGRDLMMAIDLSGSMGREDFGVDGRATNRLSVVKAAADDFIERRAGDRVGLILFSDRAYLQAPLTFDRTVVRELLDDAEVGLTGQETGIGDAIAIAVKRLKDRPAESRVLVLLTDGASNAGVMQPLAAAQLAADMGIKIYTIGVGAGLMTVQTRLGQRIVNPSEDLDEETLAQIAELTGGQYFRATDVQSLAGIYSAIDQLEPVSGDPLFMRPSVGLFYLPLGLALALIGMFAIALAWPASRRLTTLKPGPSALLGAGS